MPVVEVALDNHSSERGCVFKEVVRKGIIWQNVQQEHMYNLRVNGGCVAVEVGVVDGNVKPEVRERPLWIVGGDDRRDFSPYYKNPEIVRDCKGLRWVSVTERMWILLLFTKEIWW